MSEAEKEAEKLYPYTKGQRLFNGSQEAKRNVFIKGWNAREIRAKEELRKAYEAGCDSVYYDMDLDTVVIDETFEQWYNKQNYGND